VDRVAFLSKMFRMYPMSFNEYNIEDWMEAYKSVLSNPKINYDNLFNLMIRKWNSTANAPTPQWFEENISQVIEKDERCAAIRHIEEMRETAEPMPEYVKVRIEELKKKMSMG